MVLFIGSVLFRYEDGNLMDSNGKLVAKGKLAFGEVKITQDNKQDSAKLSGKMRIKVRIKNHQPRPGLNVIIYQKKGLGFWPFGKKLFSFVSNQPLSIPAL